LTWLSDKTADVFIMATANSVQSIPPAMLRGGRFDAIFWADLPDEKQREEILKIHLKKVNRDPKNYSKSMKELAKISEGFSGAEIEVWVKEALVHSYGRNGQDVSYDLTSDDLFEVIKGITPISRLMSKEIQESRDWANARGIKMASMVHGEASIAPTKRKIATE